MTRTLAPATEIVGVPTPTVGDNPDHLSFSQVQALHPAYKLSCPRKWAYTRLLGMGDGGPGTGLILGKAIDAAVTVYWQARTMSLAADATTLVTGRALRESLDGADWPVGAKVDELRRVVAEGLALYMEVHAEHEVPASMQAEHTFTVRAFDGDLITVVGFSDYILADGTIVDLKWTGAPKWDSTGKWNEGWLAEKRLQLTCYYMARSAAVRAGETSGPPVKPLGRLTVVTHTTKRKRPELRSVDVELTPYDRDTLIEHIRESDRIARSGVHPPRPGDACGWCPHVERCRVDSATNAVPTARLTA